MRMASWIDKCLDVWRGDGAGGLCRRIARRLAEALWQSNAADWYSVDLTCADPPAPPPGVQVAFDATEQAIAWMSRLRPRFGFAYVQPEVAAARQYGHAFGLCRVNGQEAGYIKLAFDKAYLADLQRLMDLPAGTAFICDTFVHPDFRGRRLAPLLVEAAKAEAARRGCRRLWCHIPRWNVRSIRTFTGRGFQPRGHIRNFRLLMWRFSTARPETLLNQAAVQPPTL